MFCWASTLDPCYGGQSGEHIVSASIFSSQKIIVHGPIWRADRPKVISRSNATANILCVRHNNLLSPVDKAAGEAMQALRAFMRAFELRRPLRDRHWTGTLRSRLNGPLFERFLIKTLVNMTVAKDPGYSLAGSDRFDAPPEHIVKAAYGLATLAEPAGLYFHAGVGDAVHSDREGLEALTLVADNSYCVGAAFLFRGFPFFLWLDEKLPPRSCPEFPLASLLHRPRQVNGTLFGRHSHELMFEGWF